MNPSTKPSADQTGVFSGGPAPPPTPEEAAAFEEALRAARAHFRETALAEDGIQITVGWRGPVAQPQSSPPTSRAEAPAPDGVPNTPG